MHCASLLRMLFTTLTCANECMHVRNERNFPHAKLDSKINVPFLLNEHGDLYFYGIIIVYILSSLIKKKWKLFIRQKKDIGESVLKTVTLKYNLWPQKQWQREQLFASISFKPIMRDSFLLTASLAIASLMPWWLINTTWMNSTKPSYYNYYTQSKTSYVCRFWKQKRQVKS